VFGYCLNESKEDQSFGGIGSPLEEYEFLMSEPVITNQNMASLKSPMDQELILMLNTESKNQQSQQSILSEGIESMKVNIDHVGVGGGSKPQSKQKNVIKVMLNQNYMMKEQQKMKQEKSKESLYNELLSTFDYSVSKKERVVDNSKKNNLTNSTMSLFSLNQNQLQ
jgi:hypothetical protein